MKDTVIIDVREQFEYAMDHVEGALNIPVGTLFDGEPSRLVDLPRDTEVVVYCQSGSRAQMATGILQQYGFTQVRNGINAAHVRAWQDS